MGVYVNPWQEVPNLLLAGAIVMENPPRYMEGGILRKAPLKHTPQTMLTNREVCGVQTQSRNDLGRLMAVHG